MTTSSHAQHHPENAKGLSALRPADAPANLSDLITAAELSPFMPRCCRSPTKIREMATTGQIPSYKFGRNFMFNRDEVITALKRTAVRQVSIVNETVATKPLFRAPGPCPQKTTGWPKLPTRFRYRQEAR